MKYDYMCTKRCTNQEALGKKIINLAEGAEPPEEVLQDIYIWEESHGMTESPDIRCPICQEKAEKNFRNTSFHYFTKGDCYLDKAGCRRDMNLYKMTNGGDPYASMRQPGEADDLKDRLRKGGKFNPKTKYFTT